MGYTITVAPHVRAEMQRQGLSLDALGRRMGCSRQAVCQALQTDRPSADWLERVAEALGVDPVQLIGSQLVR